jgi:hypothetical protein
MTQTEALKLALEALGNSWTEPNNEQYKIEKEAITAIKAALANEALERKAENARELGLDYEPDWKEEYQKAVDLHCITLDELREANAWIKNLEKLMANQDAMLERQTARIVELQEHIDNFDGEDR